MKRLHGRVRACRWTLVLLVASVAACANDVTPTNAIAANSTPSDGGLEAATMAYSAPDAGDLAVDAGDEDAARDAIANDDAASPDATANDESPSADVTESDAASAADADPTAPIEYCVTAPWLDTPAQFLGPTGEWNIPAGTYTLQYMGGAMLHDPGQPNGGYEVTSHYTIDGIDCGHHLYDGASPDSSATSVWLDTNGLVDDQPDVATVEAANAGHRWTLSLRGGPLFITYLDNYYDDNLGPGSRFCIQRAP